MRPSNLSTALGCDKDVSDEDLAAAKIENIQRDLNIALMNESTLIFHRLGINTKEVLDAASTKWNFHRYQPGSPGGHCIPREFTNVIYKCL